MCKLNINFDYDSTKEYRLKYENQCGCTYCRNYYKTFKKKYPKTSKFLEKYGLAVEFPIEIISLTYDKQNNEIEYEVYYPIKGTMDRDEIILNLEELEIRILKGSINNNLCPTPKMKEPYLIIAISRVKLPWILDECI